MNESITKQLERVLKGQARIEQRLRDVYRAVLNLEDIVSEQLEVLKARVERAVGVGDSLVVLVTGLSQQIRDLKDDPAALEALAETLDTNTQEWAAVVESQGQQAGPATDPVVQTAG